MSRRVAIGLWFLWFALETHGAEFRPVAIGHCLIKPDSSELVRWKMEKGPLPSPPQYVIRDYSEKPIAEGEGRLVELDIIETTLKLPKGFYEIEFPATNQRFGIVALPAWQGQAEEFFAIDGALSWLVRDDATRDGLIRVAQRSGIRMIRERLTWGAVQPSADRNDWETPARFDTLRRACAKHGLEVLEMAHDAPAWMGRVEKYPQDLVAAARSWQAIAGHWRPAWGGLEIWNEPDIFFGGNLPADQYVPLAKAIAHAMFEKHIDVPLVGGVVAHCNREFLDTAAENGLLDAIDAFSFHFYGPALEMEGLVARYREWLQAHSASTFGHRGERMPLWLTECGRPWKKGPARPPADQDAESALEIVMKGVEARACGVARYFAFVFPFYEENDHNFGMMDRWATPLRSFAAYAQMIRALRGGVYAGDWKTSDPAVRRARWFTLPPDPQGSNQDLVVLYTGRREANATVRLDLPIARVEGIDGRVLPHGPGGVAVPDGLAYVWLAKDWRQAVGSPDKRIDSNTAAMRLYRLKADPVPRRAPSPIVLRYLYDPAIVEPKSEGYRLKANPEGPMALNVRVFNLSGEQQTVSFATNRAAEGALTPGDQNPTISVPPRSSVDVSLEFDIAQRIAREGRFKAVITATAGPPPWTKVQLVLRFFGKAKEETKH